MYPFTVQSFSLQKDGWGNGRRAKSQGWDGGERNIGEASVP